MLARPRPDRDGYTHQAMVRGEVMPEFVEAVAANPEGALEAVGMGIQAHASWTSFRQLTSSSTEKIYEDFLASIFWVPDVKPREHDATCLALSMRLRQGWQSSDLFKCGFVFVRSIAQLDVCAKVAAVLRQQRLT